MMNNGEEEESHTPSKRPRLAGDSFERSLSAKDSTQTNLVGGSSTALSQSDNFSSVADTANSNGDSMSVCKVADKSEAGLHSKDDHQKLEGSIDDDESESDLSQLSSPPCKQDDALDNISSDSSDDLDNLSELSNLSGFSEESWQPVAGPISWVQRQMSLGHDPRSILQELIPSGTEIPSHYDQLTLWKIIINLLSEPPPRKKLPHINLLEDVLCLLKTCSKIMVLTGAGVSVSCGIPDFRSRDGIYARLAKDFPNLPDPQAMFDIQFFKSDQRPFFKFAKEIYPGQFEPSRCHKFIKLLEDHGKLLRNYTQNIDTLEQVAGIQHVIQCHGSFATATCMVCKYKTDAEAIRKDIFDQVIPLCPKCGIDTPLAVMKPDIVFFGESLPGEFHRQMAADKNECDMLIVIGSSLKVRPVALIPNSLPSHVPQILINREPLPNLHFDVELLGNCDDIVSELCKHLGPSWDHLAISRSPAKQVLLSDLNFPFTHLSSVHSDKINGIGNGGIDEKELVEHSADSGLGDVDALPSTLFVGVENVPLLETEKSSGSECEREKRFGSSDSGIEAGGSTNRQDSGDVHVSSLCQTCKDSSETEFAQSETGFCHTQLHTVVHECMHEDVSKKISTVEQIPHSRSVDLTVSAEDSQSKPSELKTDIDIPISNALHPVCDVGQLQKKEIANPDKVSPVSQENLESTANKSVPSLHLEHDSVKKDNVSHKRHDVRTHSINSDGNEKMDLNREMRKDNAHCSHNDTIDEMRRMWVPRRHLSLAARLGENQYLYIPPSCYVFSGAEVFSDDGSSDSDDSDDSNSSSPQRDDDGRGLVSRLFGDDDNDSKDVTHTNPDLPTVPLPEHPLQPLIPSDISSTAIPYESSTSESTSLQHLKTLHSGLQNCDLKEDTGVK